MNKNEKNIRESVLSQFNIVLIPTDVPDVQTVALPPKGFDPLKASTEELRMYHFPHRPDPRTSPAAVKAWRKAMSRMHTFVVPKLKLQDPSRRRSFGLPAPDAAHGTTSGWAGMIASEGSFTEVWGIMEVPNVVVPNGPIVPPVDSGDPNYCFSAWVGLDGADGSGDVCQAGIEFDLSVDSSGTVTPTRYAWVEWFPLDTVVENFDFSPGDTVAVMIQYLGLNSQTRQYYASCHLSNLTTGVAMSPVILSLKENSQPGAVFQGNTAEWIVEPTAFEKNSVWINAALPDFGDLVFVDAGALSQPGSDKGTVIDASKETQTTNVVVNNVTVASEVSTAALQISFLATAGSGAQPGYEFPL